MDYLIYVGLALVGVCMGSFAGASVWRLRARQLVTDKKDGEPVDSKELKRLKPLAKARLLDDRSRCLHCGYELRWYDLVPIVSWISLKGKCRHCHHPIGYFELIIEVGVALFFVLSYILWPFGLESWQEITRLVLWLASGAVLAILFAYDAKWFLLPDVGNIILTVLGAMTAGIVILGSKDPLLASVSVVVAIGALAGIYGLLYVISKGRWIGFGDVKLGIGLGLLLADWRLALVALFSANLIGTLVVLPGLVVGKLQSGARVPFGPFLIIGTVLAGWFGPDIISWYTAIVLL